MGQEIQNFIDVSNKIIEDLKKIDNELESLTKVGQAEHDNAKKINQALDDEIQFIVKKKQELLCALNSFNLAIERDQTL